MAVNDIRMLPQRVRSMDQMEELLQAEQLLLDMIEAIIIDMAAEASVSNNTPMTKANSEYIASVISGSACYIKEYPETLTINIVVTRQTGAATSLIKLRNYMNELLPAHLKFNIHYEFRTAVLIRVSSTSYIYPHDLCGDGFAGEYPDITTKGKILPVSIQAITEGKGYLNEFKFTGEQPIISTLGSISFSSVIPIVTSSAYSYEIEFCAEDDYCGED